MQHPSAEEAVVLLQLQRAFGDVTEAVRITDTGLWHPTPLEVLASSAQVMAAAGWVRAHDTVLDAGAGDGRVVAALALSMPRMSLRLLGVESDAGLVAEARRRLEGLTPPVTVVEGNYLADPAQTLRAVDVVLNYPDGQEQELLRCFRRHGKAGARLLILSPESAPDLGSPPAARLNVKRGGTAVSWSLSMFVR